MKQTYDFESDTLFIKLVEDDHEVRTVNLRDEAAPDFASGELLLGFEILDAKEDVEKETSRKLI